MHQLQMEPNSYTICFMILTFEGGDEGDMMMMSSLCLWEPKWLNQCWIMAILPRYCPVSQNKMPHAGWLKKHMHCFAEGQKIKVFSWWSYEWEICTVCSQLLVAYWLGEASPSSSHGILSMCLSVSRLTPCSLAHSDISIAIFPNKVTCGRAAVQSLTLFKYVRQSSKFRLANTEWLLHWHTRAV